MNENEAITVTLTLENDEELECAVLSIFEAEEREYIALLPLDDQEFERVSNAFNELMEEQDFADIDLDELED